MLDTTPQADSVGKRILAILVTVGFFAVLITLVVVGKPQTGGDLLVGAFGALTTAFVQVVASFFKGVSGSAS